MKVCVLQPVLDPFKGGNHLPLLASLPDVSLTVVCNRSKVDPNDLPDNVEVVIVPGRMGPYYYGCSDYRFASLVLGFAPPSDPFWEQFDVIHINQTMGPALRRLQKTKKPLLLTIHHPVTADLEVAVAESTMLQSILWRLKYALLVCWQREMCTHVTKIMTVSETMKRRLVREYGVLPDDVLVVPNGVDGSVFQLSDQNPDFDIIAVGSFMHPRKGFRYLEQVYRSLTNKGYTVADVGRRSDAQRQILETIDGVKTFGTVDSDTLINLMQRSQALVSTSLYEGFGLSLIESLSCGHPAFAFSVGAVPEVLKPVDPDLLVAPKNVQTLVHRIEEFLTLSTEEKRRKGEEYRRKVLDLYSLEKSTQALLAVYRSL